MKINTEKLKDNFNRDNYWTKIYFSSDDDKENTTVLVCASYEYLWTTFNSREFDDLKLSSWLDRVKVRWEKEGSSIFKNTIHYDVYATTNEGKINGLEFLEKEIVPM